MSSWDKPSAVELPNGVELHYAREGEGEDLILIHGAMGDWRSWEPQWKALTKHYRCLSYSRRYSFPNNNTMPSPDHSAVHETQDLLYLLDALNIQRPLVVGSSYGGFVAMQMVAHHADRVRAVVAVEPPMMKYARLTPEGNAIADAFKKSTIEPANAAFRAGHDEEASRMMTGGIAGAARAPDAAGMAKRLQNIRAMKMLALSSDEFPWISPEALNASPVPVLLLSGGDTPAVHDAIFTNLRDRFTRATYRKVPGAGHGVSREQPEVFNALVHEFMNSVP